MLLLGLSYTVKYCVFNVKVFLLARFKVFSLLSHCWLGNQTVICMVAHMGQAYILKSRSVLKPVPILKLWSRSEILD